MNYTPEQVAEMYFCNSEWVRTLIKKEKDEAGSGKFPNAFKPENSRRWFIPESDIEPKVLANWKEVTNNEVTNDE